MSGRFTKPLSPMGKEWDAATRARIYEQFRSLEAGMSGLQGTPDDPTTIIAGDIVIPEPNQSPAPSNHTHPISTAAPSTDVALGGATDEGSSSSLLRSDARLKLAPGDVGGDQLVWDGVSEWVPTQLPASGNILELRAFMACRHPAIPGPDDAQVVLAYRIFGR